MSKNATKWSINDNFRQLVLLRLDPVLVNSSTCFFTGDSGIFFFTFPTKWVGRAMGNEVLNWDGHIIPEMSLTTQWQNDYACSAIFACKFACHRVQCANSRSRERTKHIFLQILSHQWTEMSLIVYKDIGTLMEMLQKWVVESCRR